MAPSRDLEAELIEFTRERLAHFKCPKTIDFVDTLPRQDNGKIYRRLLRDMYRNAADPKLSQFRTEQRSSADHLISPSCLRAALDRTFCWAGVIGFVALEAPPLAGTLTLRATASTIAPFCQTI